MEVVNDDQKGKTPKGGDQANSSNQGANGAAPKSTANDELVNDANKDKAAPVSGTQDGTNTGPIVGGDQANSDATGNGPGDDINEPDYEADRQKFKEQDEAEKEKFMDDLANRVASKIKAAGSATGQVVGAGDQEKPIVESLSDHEAKLKKYGPGYVDAKQTKTGAETTFTAKAWSDLNGTEGWKKVVTKPAELND